MSLLTDTLADILYDRQCELTCKFCLLSSDRWAGREDLQNLGVDLRLPTI